MENRGEGRGRRTEGTRVERGKEEKDKTKLIELHLYM